jgi:ribonuclease HI
MQERLTLNFDGGSRGNPGPGGIGVVITAEDGTPLVTLGRFIGHATNNVAEYLALITALEEAAKLGAKNVMIRGDSQLVIRQMTGQYRVKNADLRKLYDRAVALAAKFEKADFAESRLLRPRLGHFHREGIIRPEHVRAENDVLHRRA